MSGTAANATFSAISVTDPANFATFSPISNLLTGGQWDPSVSSQQGDIKIFTPYRAVFTFSQASTVASFQYMAIGDGTHDSPSVSVSDAGNNIIYSTNVNIPLKSGGGQNMVTVTLPTAITNVTKLQLAFNPPVSGFQAIVAGPFTFSTGTGATLPMSMPATFTASNVVDPNGLQSFLPVSNLLAGGQWDPMPFQNRPYTAIFSFTQPQNVSIIQYTVLGDGVHDSAQLTIANLSTTTTTSGSGTTTTINTTTTTSSSSSPNSPMTVALPVGNGTQQILIFLPMPLASVTQLQLTWASPISGFQSIVSGPTTFAGISPALAAQCCANNGFVSGVNCGQFNGQPVGQGAGASPCGLFAQMVGSNALQDPNWIKYLQLNSGSGEFDNLVKSACAQTANGTLPFCACTIPQKLDPTIPPALAMILQANPQCTSTNCVTSGYKLVNQNNPCQINFQQCLQQQTVNNQGQIGNAVTLSTSTNCQQMVSQYTGGGTGTTANTGGSTTGGTTGTGTSGSGTTNNTTGGTGGSTTGTTSTTATPSTEVIIAIIAGFVGLLIIVAIVIAISKSSKRKQQQIQQQQQQNLQLMEMQALRQQGQQQQQPQTLPRL